MYTVKALARPLRFQSRHRVRLIVCPKRFSASAKSFALSYRETFPLGKAATCKKRRGTSKKAVLRSFCAYSISAFSFRTLAVICLFHRERCLFSGKFSPPSRRFRPRGKLTKCLGANVAKILTFCAFQHTREVNEPNGSTLESTKNYLKIVHVEKYTCMHTVHFDIFQLRVARR